MMSKSVVCASAWVFALTFAALPAVFAPDSALAAQATYHNWHDTVLHTGYDGVYGSVTSIVRAAGVNDHIDSAAHIEFEPDAADSVNCWWVSPKGMNNGTGGGGTWHVAQANQLPGTNWNYPQCDHNAIDSDTFDSYYGWQTQVGGYGGGQYLCDTHDCYGVALHKFTVGNVDTTEAQYFYDSNDAAHSTYDCWHTPGC